MKDENFHLCTDHFLNAILDLSTTFGSGQQVNGFDIRTRTKKLLDQDFAHKSRTARHEDAAISIEFRDGWQLHSDCETCRLELDASRV